MGNSNEAESGANSFPATGRTGNGAPQTNGESAHFIQSDNTNESAGIGRTDALDENQLQAPLPANKSESASLGFWSFRNQPQAKLEWVIEGLVYKGVLGLTGGYAKTGKTQLTLRMCIAMLTQDSFLKWTVLPNNERITFLSLEMRTVELNYLLQAMTDLDPEKHSELEDRLHIEVGLSQNLMDKNVQKKLVDLLRRNGSTGLVIDALGSIVTGSLNEDTHVRATMDFLQTLQEKLGIWIWLVHHTRKPDTQHKPKPPAIEDIYGNQYIAGRIRSSLGLFKVNEEGLLQVGTPALTLAKSIPDFYVQRTEELNFELVDGPKSKPPDTVELIDTVKLGFKF